MWAGVKLAFKDYRLYLFILMHHLNSLANTFVYFFPSIVETLNVPKLTSLLLTVPGKYLRRCAMNGMLIMPPQSGLSPFQCLCVSTGLPLERTTAPSTLPPS